ncbi:MAG: rhomboid family intramembrane serine protease [Saprospiraceae bacterium]|nr:rhomboid family intramembrane serine protease [Saprospiraceae bacterium]MBK7466759.1 rhomboid family intramembrane serine protease [Saprospiraceae bacterium]
MNIEIKEQRERLVYSLKVALGVCFLCIFIHILFIVIPYPNYYFSIYPRTISQWHGILTGHYIHGSWAHLFSNIPPLLVTVGMIFFFYRTIGWAVYTMIWVLTGFAVFMFARQYSHVGASGLVYGFISFIFFSGIFRRNARSIILMTIIVIMYSGYSAGFLPTDAKVSWESHIFGALAGAWTAFVFRNYKEVEEKEPEYEWKGKDREPKDYFLSRDSFDKTKKERLDEARRLEEERKAAENNQSTTWDLF